MPSTIRDLTELTAVAVDDYVLISDTSDVTNRDKRISVTNLQSGVAKKTGTPVVNRVATWADANTLQDGNMSIVNVVTRTGTPIVNRLAIWADATTLQDGAVTIADVARLSILQTYTRGHIINPPTGDIGLLIDTVANPTERPLRIRMNGVERLNFLMNNTNNQFSVGSFDNGAAPGSVMIIGHNNNASTPAPGTFLVTGANATNYSIYPDNSGVWRTITGLPTNATFATGTVVGAQTSHAKMKDVLGEPISDSEALQMIVAAAELVRRFVYKNGAYGGEEFSGLVLDGDELHRYGMDADADHKAGKSLNVISVIGDLCLALRELAGRVDALATA